MQLTGVVLGSLFFMLLGGWETDFDTAKQKAQQEHKYILLNFSGSDWCVPCINLRHEIFESPSFKEFADNNLVLLNADFPRLKKNQLSKDQQKKNDQLADKYNPQGSFPYTLLLDARGKVVHLWDGVPKATPEEFITEVKTYVNAGN
jgi:thioredoxin-related protein